MLRCRVVAVVVPDVVLLFDTLRVSVADVDEVLLDVDEADIDMLFALVVENCDVADSDFDMTAERDTESDGDVVGEDEKCTDKVLFGEVVRLKRGDDEILEDFVGVFDTDGEVVVVFDGTRDTVPFVPVGCGDRLGEVLAFREAVSELETEGDFEIAADTVNLVDTVVIAEVDAFGE